MTTKRVAIDFETPLHHALRLRSAETHGSISELVNAAVRASLAEDADDFAAFRDRRSEHRKKFEAVVRDLTRRRKR